MAMNNKRIKENEVEVEKRTTYFLAMTGNTLLACADDFMAAHDSGKEAYQRISPTSTEPMSIYNAWIYKSGEALPDGAKILIADDGRGLLPDDGAFAVAVYSYAVKIINSEDDIATYDVHALSEEHASDIAWEAAEENYHLPKRVLSVF